jgi:hypothetical protein
MLRPASKAMVAQVWRVQRSRGRTPWSARAGGRGGARQRLLTPIGAFSALPCMTDVPQERMGRVRVPRGASGRPPRPFRGSSYRCRARLQAGCTPAGASTRDWIDRRSGLRACRWPALRRARTGMRPLLSTGAHR